MDKLSLNQLNLLNRMTSRIRQSLDLQEILDTTVKEARSFLRTDRVKIYKFDSEGNGQVIAESIYKNRLPSLLGLHFPAGDIPPQARELFCQARVRSIVNLEAQQIRLSEPDRLPSTATGELKIAQVRQHPLSILLQRPVDPCHVEYLTLMGVQSSLVVPILQDRSLWGLLISHNARTKKVFGNTLRVLQTVVNQLEIAISQSHLLTQVKEKADREMIINQIAGLLYTPAEIEQALEIVLQEMVQATGSSGGRLCLRDLANCHTCGAQPDLSMQEWDELLARLPPTEPTIVQIDRAPIFAPYLSAFAETSIRAIAILPLHYQQEILGHGILFRNAIDSERVWAGYWEQDERQQRPRQSFEEWHEIQKGKAPEWTQRDRELLQALSHHLAMAILQDRLYRREREQRLLVEMRNRELDTARKIAEEASRLKSDFLSSTSHELRTPLASTLTYLKLLKEGFYDNPVELKEYIEAAHLSAEHLTQIINDILDIAKIEAGRMQVDKERLDLPPFLAKIHDLFRADSVNRNINLTFECEVDRIWTDDNRLRQVLINLLSNAFKFTERGEICVRVAPLLDADPPMIRFSVSDTGIGVDPKVQKLLFEAFVQGEGSMRRRYGGTGLGLTICKKLVEVMGGEIWLESEGKNCGTTVTFLLPDL
ncbi:ATP-binding protein [Lusitaniella coriacea]|uniref:ATP-binding protein n=1 Tax=Lusitaniella coriacea TaxID=1983105 RepID=UPI003CF7BA98